MQRFCTNTRTAAHRLSLRTALIAKRSMPLPGRESRGGTRTAKGGCRRGQFRYIAPSKSNSAGTENRRHNKAGCTNKGVVRVHRDKTQQHSNASSRPGPPRLWRCKGSQWLKAGGSKWQDCHQHPPKVPCPSPKS